MKMSREHFKQVSEFTVLPSIVSVITLETMEETIALLKGIDRFEAQNIVTQFEQCVKDFDFAIHHSRVRDFDYSPRQVPTTIPGQGRPTEIAP